MGGRAVQPERSPRQPQHPWPVRWLAARAQVSPKPGRHQRQRGTVTARFTNVGRRSTPVYLAEERLDPQLGERPRFVLPRLVPGEEKRLRYTVRSRHRRQRRSRHQRSPKAPRHEQATGVRASDRPQRATALPLGRLVGQIYPWPRGV